jgi:hypothetical protein
MKQTHTMPRKTRWKIQQQKNLSKAKRAGKVSWTAGVVKQDSEKHGIKDKFSWMSPTRKQIPMTVG